MEIFDQAPVPVDIANMMGIVVTGATAAVDVSAGQYVILQHSTISGVADGLYKAVNAKTAGTAFVSGDLTAVTTGGYNSINSDKVDISDIANNLTTNTAGKVLDARQGKALSEQIANHGECVVLCSVDKPTGDSDIKSAQLSYAISNFRYIMVMSAYDNTGDINYGNVIEPIAYASKHTQQNTCGYYETVNGGCLRYWFETSGTEFKVNTRSDFQRNAPTGNKILVIGIK